MISLRSLSLGFFCTLFGLAFSDCTCKPHSSPNSLVNDIGDAQAANLDFGNVPVGQAASQSIVLKNAGAGVLNLQPLTQLGPNANDFHLTAKFPTSLQPGASAVVGVVFTPSGSGGAESATVSVPNDGSSGTLDIQLTGNGVDITICTAPAALDFGNVQVKGAPAQLGLVITNCGNSDAQITFNPIEGAQASDFAVTGETNGTLAVGASLNLTVTYSPQVMGASSADLPFVVCQGCTTTQSVNLTGVGVDGQIVCSPSPVNFGNVPVGSTPLPTIGVSCTNVGTEQVSVTGLGTESNLSLPFALSGGPTLPLTLLPNASFSVTVTYTPSGLPNGDTDTLVAVYAVPDPTVVPYQTTDQLSGNVSLNPCSLTIAPASANFGNVAPNTTGQKTVTLTDVGMSACNVTGIALDPSSDPDFALASGQATSFTVQPGSSATISVTFTPVSSAPPLARKGTLDFQTGDNSNPNAQVPLQAFISNSDYAGGWPKWHYDNNNTGQTASDTSALKGTVAWTHNIGAPNAGGSSFGLGGGTTYINSPVVSIVTSSPSIPYAIYQLGMSGILYAFDNTGAVLWQQQLSDPSGDPHPSTPAVLKDGSIYVISGSDNHGGIGGNQNNLFYLSPSGSVLYSMPYGEDGFDACPGLANDGTLFEADDDGPASSGGSENEYSAIAFQASSSGTVNFLAGLALPINTESERFGIVIGDDDSSYWGNNGQFFAISPPPAFQLSSSWPNGGVTLADPTTLGVSEVVSDLALDNQTTGNLYAYSAWEFGASGRKGHGGGGPLSVAGMLVALDPSSGATRWTFNLPQTALPSSWTQLQSNSGNAAPAVASDGTVYVGNSDGLYAINGAAGTLKWQFKSANVISSPAIGGDGTIFFGCSDSNFYAVNPSDGTLRFEIHTGGPISSSPAIAPDGTVLFVSDDGNLYAVQ